MLLTVPQQAQHKQRRQRAQVPALGHILHHFKLDGGGLQLSQRSQQPFLQPGRGHAQGRLLIGHAALAFARACAGGLQPSAATRRLFFLICLSRPSSRALCNVLARMCNCRLITGTLCPSSNKACAWASRSGVSRSARRRAGGLKKALAPPWRYWRQQRLTVVNGSPKACTICPCVAVPLTMSCVVKKRKLAKSSTGWLKTGRWPLK